MPTDMNPLTAPFSLVKQMGEQTNAMIQGFGTSATQATSQMLDTLMAAAPPVPGMPGVPAARAGLPGIQRVLGQVESLLIPPGLPRPSQAMAPAPTPNEVAAAEVAAAAIAANGKPVPVQPGTAMTSRRKVLERRGI